MSQLADVERAPQTALLREQSGLQDKNNALGSVKTQLGILQNAITALKDPSLFDSRTAASSNTALGTVSVSAGATVGKYTFAISQLATSTVYTGASQVGNKLSGHDLSQTDLGGADDVKLSTAGFINPVTAGTFTVNGQQVTVAATDTLAGIFKKIATATGGAVNATYSTDSDTIKLASASPIVLGSATDTSNFLQIAKLYANNGKSLESESKLGSVSLSGKLNAANFTTPMTGGSAGEFQVNGVSIKYDSANDSVADVLNRINSSTAGVMASYDSINNRFSMVNKNTGSVGIALADVAGSNFLQATGLLNSSIELGKNLQYTINNGGTLTSQSNTITAASSGLTGLSVTALAAATTDHPNFTVTVGMDTGKIKSAISSFVSAYNATQAYINTNTASSTDAHGKVTAGILADEPEVTEISSRLRGLTNSSIHGLRLDSLGFASNGYDDNLATTNASALDTALANDPASVKDFFTNATSGLAVGFDAYLTSTVGDDGSLTKHQTTISGQALAINTQVSDMEKLVQDDIARMDAEFQAMETAQANTNQQLAFLTKTFA